MTRGLRNAVMFGLLIGVMALAGCMGPNASPANSGGTVRPQMPDPPSPPSMPADQKYALPPSPPTTQADKNLAPPPPIVGPIGDLASQRVRICAWVNSKPIFEGELLTNAGFELSMTSKMAEPERSVKRKEILKKHLKKVIDDEIVYQDAVRKLEKTPQFLDKLKEMARKDFNKWTWKKRQEYKMDEYEFKELLKFQGTSLEDQYRQSERIFIGREYIGSRVGPQLDKVGHRDILGYYKTHLNEFQSVDRVEWEDIFLQLGSAKAPTLDYARQLAEWVAGQMAAGAPIEKLLEYDGGDSKSRNGKGNGERRGEIRPVELEPYLFTMKLGQVAPPVELSTGIHIFRLTKRDYASQMPFTEEVQGKIREKLKREIYQKEYERIIRQLANQTVIEVDSEVIQ